MTLFPYPQRFTGNKAECLFSVLCFRYFWLLLFLAYAVHQSILRFHWDIPCHPKSPDSMAKSSFIFRFLQNHENMLFGTVYVGGSSPNIPNTYSDIVIKLRQDGPKHQYYGMKWNGKWLFTESGELVSQKEITKRDLHPQLYGDIRPESNLYDFLGFAKSEEDQLEEAAKDYDQLDDETKEQFFEIELRREIKVRSHHEHDRR